jgi:hypothetical protein
VTGNYLQVAGRASRLSRVNTALRGAGIGDEEQDWRDYRPYPPWPPGTSWYVAYQAVPDRRLVSASTVVVSALIRVSAPPPHGNEGAWWGSVTVDVATGHVVRLGDLFAGVAPALKALARAARRELSANNPCVRGSLADPQGHYALGFAPTTVDYQDFALLPTGIAVGFSNDQVSGPACGRVEVTIPYSVVRPFMAKEGIRLMRGVRWPKTFRTTP